MLHNKNEALDAFIIFKVEVEKQCGKRIKIVRTDRGGEYYGRYTEDRQAPRPFVDSCPIYHAWFFGLEWCCRKKKPNFDGNGAKYA